MNAVQIAACRLQIAEWQMQVSAVCGSPAGVVVVDVVDGAVRVFLFVPSGCTSLSLGCRLAFQLRTGGSPANVVCDDR